MAYIKDYLTYNNIAMALTQSQMDSLNKLREKGYTDTQIGEMTRQRAEQTGQTNALEKLKSDIVGGMEQTKPVEEGVPNVMQPSPSTPQPTIPPTRPPKQTTNATTTPSPTSPQPVQTVQPTQPKPVEKPKEGVQAFGYETTPEQREERNNKLAQGLIDANKNFDANYIANYIRQSTPGVLESDIQNTVSDIKNKFDTMYNIKQKVKTLESMGDDIVAEKITKGDISLDDLELLKTINPNKYDNIYNMYQENNKRSTYNDLLKTMSGEKTDTKDTSAGIYAKLMENLNKTISQGAGLVSSSDIIENYKSQLNSPEVLDLNTKVIGLQDKIADYDLQIENLSKEYKEKYPNMNESMISKLVSDASESIIRARNSTARELTTQSNLLNSKLNNIDNNYKLSLQTRQEENEIRQQQYQQQIQNFQLQYGIYKDAQEVEQARQDREDKWKQIELSNKYQIDAENRAWEKQLKALDIEKGNIDSTDPRAQRQGILASVEGIINNFKSMGVPFQRDANTITNDIINQLKKEGKEINSANVAEALKTNVIEQAKTKPEYKNWVNANSGINKNDYIDYPIYNSEGKRVSTGLYNKYDPSDRYILSEGTSAIVNTEKYQKQMNKQDGTYGGQCGTFVNNALGERIFGDTLKQKLEQKNSENPVEGAAVIMTSPLYPKNGHVAIVESVNGDGTITIKESNWSGKEIVGTRTISINDQSILGYYNKPGTTETTTETTKLPQSKKSSADLISSGFVEVPEDSEYTSKIASSDGRPLAKLSNILGNEKKSIESWLQVKEELPKIKELFDKLDNEGKTGPVAGQYSKTVGKYYDTDIQAVNSFLNSVLPNLARGVFGEVGVLTNQDIENYKKTLADFTQTTEARNRILGDLMEKLKVGIPKKIKGLEKSNYNIEGYRYLLPTKEETTQQATQDEYSKIKADLSNIGNMMKGWASSFVESNKDPYEDLYK